MMHCCAGQMHSRSHSVFLETWRDEVEKKFMSCDICDTPVPKYKSFEPGRRTTSRILQPQPPPQVSITASRTMLSEFPVETATSPSSPKSLKNLEALPVEHDDDVTLNGNCGLTEKLHVEQVYFLAFALLLESYLGSRDVSFLHGGAACLRQIDANLDFTWTVQESLVEIEKCSRVIGDQEKADFGYVPCLLLDLDLDGIESIPDCLSLADVGLVNTTTSFVAAYVCNAASPKAGQFRFYYDPSVVSTPHAQRVSDQFRCIVDHIARSSREVSLQDVMQRSLSTTDARELRKWNKAPQVKDYRTVHGRIGEWLSQIPQQVCIYAWDGQFTREQLDEASNLITDSLVAKGCGRGEVVAILVDRSAWTPVAILAAIKTGAAFILLDQDLPIARLRIMMETVRCQWAIASRENVPLATRLVDNVVSINAMGLPQWIKSNKAFERRQQQPLASSPDDTVFFTFTSGSTGNPKAVEIQHFAWCSGQTAQIMPYLPGPGTRCMHIAAFSFTVAIVELLFPLVNGSTVCIPSTYERTNDLTNAMRRLRPNWLTIAPSLARTLVPEQLPTLETISLVGEPSSTSLQRVWLNSHVRRVQIAFGSSEGCNHTSMRLCSLSEMSSQNIGRALAPRYWIVHPDDHNRLMPIGAVGELVLEGYGIAKAYFGEVAKSREAFISGPSWAASFSAGESGRRWYKTGDLVKYNDRGEVLLLGRKDLQVKLRGQRLEPAEVETQIMEQFQGEIKNAVVEITQIDNDAEKARLSAFVILDVPPQDDQEGYAKDLERRMVAKLSETLPAFMVPTHLVVLEEFPKTTSGKISRRSLREFGADNNEPHENGSSSDAEEESPGTNGAPILLELRKLWAEVLKRPIDKVKNDSNWSGLGGDSVSASLLVHKARAAGLPLTVADVFRYSSLRELAYASHASKERSHLQKIQDDVPSVKSSLQTVTSFQKYTLDMSAGSNRSLVLHHLITIRGKADVQPLEDAVWTMFRRCDALRLKFERDPTIAGGIRQSLLDVEDPEVRSRIRVTHCEDSDKAAKELVLHLNQFEDTEWTIPVLWTLLVSPDKVAMVARFHHAVLDGTSTGLVLREFEEVYMSADNLPPRPQFVPYMLERLVPHEAESFQYWRSLLQGSTPTKLRKSAAELADNNGDIGDLSVKRIVTLPSVLPHAATMATLTKSAWAIVLAGMAGKKDVVFYYLLNGRDENFQGSLDLVGCCVTEVPMRIDLDQTTTTKALLNHVQEQMLNSVPHAHLGADTIASECTEWGQEHITYRHSSFLHHSNFENVRHFALGDAAYADVETVVNEDTVMDFAVSSSPVPGNGLELVVEASKQRYTLEELETVVNWLVQAIHCLCEEPERSMEDILEKLAVNKM